MLAPAPGIQQSIFLPVSNSPPKLGRNISASRRHWGISLYWEHPVQVPSTNTQAPWAWLLLPVQAVRVSYNSQGDASVSALFSSVMFFSSANFCEQESPSFPQEHAPRHWTQSKPVPSGHCQWRFLDGEGKKLDQKTAGCWGTGLWRGKWVSWSQSAGGRLLRNSCSMNKHISMPMVPAKAPETRVCYTLCGMDFFYLPFFSNLFLH